MFERLYERIRREEGFDRFARWDRKGATIGHGHQVPMTPDEFRYLRSGVDRQEAGELLRADINRAMDELDRAFSWLEELDEVRHAALTEMAFQMGLPTLRRFPKMLGALEAGDWQKAHDEALDSAWARDPQPGVRNRAREIARMFLTGEWAA